MSNGTVVHDPSAPFDFAQGRRFALARREERHCYETAPNK
jgi:hypothetical protein